MKHRQKENESCIPSALMLLVFLVAAPFVFLAEVKTWKIRNEIRVTQDSSEAIIRHLDSMIDRDIEASKSRLKANQ